MFKIVSFYKFVPLGDASGLDLLKERLLAAMKASGVHGTIIIAEEGYNAMLSGGAEAVDSFIASAEGILNQTIVPKESFADEEPLGKVEVKIKPEIVTLKRQVDIGLGEGTHVPPEKWNEIITSEDVYLLDTRNDYEFKTGTFEGAVNPATEKFSELPEFVKDNLDPGKHKKVAMFCTGGIRCEKFAPFLVAQGFQEVYQLEGGILKYLETVSEEDSLWRGECYVFDKRVTLAADLSVGSRRDLSGRHAEPLPEESVDE
ncbi:MAG: hypothetical protein KF881_07655 [Acidobacteria bacterium]|nr:hypothetical protein [Acidobacteriota bacterium]